MGRGGALTVTTTSSPGFNSRALAVIAEISTNLFNEGSMRSIIVISASLPFLGFVIFTIELRGRLACAPTSP